MSNFIVYISSFLFLSIITPSNATDLRQTTLDEYPFFVASTARSSGGTSPISDLARGGRSPLSDLSVGNISRVSSFCAPQIAPSAPWYVSDAGNWVLQLKHHEYATIIGTELKYRSGYNVTEHYFPSVQDAKLSAEQWARADGILPTLKRS